MGVKYIYGCDNCNKWEYVDIEPFEGSDPGECTPNGWVWKYDGSLYCAGCHLQEGR
jgi:hypothetical protein